MFKKIFYFILLIICIAHDAFAQNYILQNNILANKFQNKDRITEILRRDNYKIIEPFYFVSNRPTIEQALTQEMQNGAFISPDNHLTYCPPNQDMYSYDTTTNGTVYIGAENLPKNGNETSRWFLDAYRYRIDTDAAAKPSNIVITTPKRRNYFMVKCPQTHNNIIVARGISPTPSSPQMVVDTQDNLKYAGDESDKKDFNVTGYILPSTDKNDLNRLDNLQTETNNNTVNELSPPAELIKSARTISQNEKVFIKLLLAIAQTGSNYDVNFADKRTGHYGVMATPTAALILYNVPSEAIYNADTNLNLGAKYFKRLYQIFSGDLDKTLRAYYAGFKTIDDTGKMNTPESIYFANQVKSYINISQPMILEGDM